MKRSLVLLALSCVALLSCKKREGQVCQCASDCQDGLVCAVGPTLLESGECAPGSAVGECVQEEDSASGSGTGVDIIMFDDMPSKRDLPTDSETGETSDTGTDTGEETETGDTGMDTGEETGETGMETGEETGETGMETGEETGETGMETGDETESSTT